MTRKADAADSPEAERTSANLNGLRVQIDKLDLQIVDLLNKRASVAAQIGKVKSEAGGEVFSARPGRRSARQCAVQLERPTIAELPQIDLPRTD